MMVVLFLVRQAFIQVENMIIQFTRLALFQLHKVLVVELVLLMVQVLHSLAVAVAAVLVLLVVLHLKVTALSVLQAKVELEEGLE